MFLILEPPARSSTQPEQQQPDTYLERSEELETQTSPQDSELFETIRSPRKQPCPTSDQHRQPNYSTVRIYAHSLHLSDSPTPEPIRPSVITVERAALCSIFLETKYQRTLKEPSEREVRRQTLQDLVCKGKELTPPQKERFNDILSSVESEWSRLSRVRPSLEAFELERKLGSGGFGVVNMVKEKTTGNVYAMKVPPFSGF